MADWNKPTLTSTEQEYTDELKARDEDLAKQFDGVSASNLPEGTIRWNSVNKLWEKLVSGVWQALCDVYNIVVSRAQQADNADKLDGYDAGTGANQVLVLDSNGLVPLANIPATLTGKDADTVDGAHATVTPTAGAIPIAGQDGKLAAGWIPDATPVGTRMLFGSVPPAGWVLVTDIHDRVLRIVDSSDLVGQTGGSWVISGIGSAGSHSHSISSGGSHSHSMASAGSHTHDFQWSPWNELAGGEDARKIEGISSAGAHTHTIYAAGSHNHGGATGTAGDHTHSFDGSWRPAYLNVVMAEKQ